MITKTIAAFFVNVLLAGGAQAALIDRGGGLIYDTDRNITWLADANLIASNTFGLGYNVYLGPHPDVPSGYPSNYLYEDGTATWGAALHWIDAMNAANYLGYDDWRLPSALNPDGSEPCGYLNCTGGELGHLFYDELGGNANSSILNSEDPDLALFTNFQSYVYWYGEPYLPAGIGVNNVWNFRMDEGLQGLGSTNGQNLYVMAVRDGDVVAAAIPEPSTYAMFLAGLGLIGFMASRRKSC